MHGHYIALIYPYLYIYFTKNKNIMFERHRLSTTAGHIAERLEWRRLLVHGSDLAILKQACIYPDGLSQGELGEPSSIMESDRLFRLQGWD